MIYHGYREHKDTSLMIQYFGHNMQLPSYKVLDNSYQHRIGKPNKMTTTDHWKT
jgi:hypothetical protein